MKLHRNLAVAVVSALEAVFERGEVAEKVVEQALSNSPKWGKRDRAFVASTTYEIVRHQRFLAACVGEENGWALLFAQLVRSETPLPDWSEFAAFDVEKTRANLARRNFPFAVAQSLPDWLDEVGREELGARWETEIPVLNSSAPVVVRANRSKNSRDEVEQILNAANIKTARLDWAPDALVLLGRPNLKPFLNAGILEVQDASSQLVAPFVGAQNGETIIDACAGAGGKTLHLSALAPDAKIVALDVSRAKLGELQRRAERNGAGNIEIRAVDKAVLKRLKGEADRVLIDAPCSGTGTMRRQSGLKWRLTPDFLREVTGLQRDILENYQSLLKPGGILVYATCSIFPRENVRQVEWFLEQNPGFHLEEMRAISPRESGFDGFFVARLKKQS